MRRPVNERLLIIASSARALAASAVRGGYRPDVIDQFADADTREYAAECHVTRGDLHGLAPAPLLACLAAYRARHGHVPILVGAGFESRPDLITRLAGFGTVLGNNEHAVRRVKDPAEFATALARLNVSAPRISLAPVTAGEWLCKPRGGCGGVGIHRWLAGGELPAGYYLQEFITGRQVSVLFLADGRRHRIIGYNQCETASDTDMRFAAVVRSPAPPEPLVRRLETAVAAVVKEFGLRGLCGLDVIVDGNDYWILEVNPRPPASFELHETGSGLVAASIAACHGDMVQPRPGSGWPGKRVVYAREDCMIRPGFSWPAWCADRPLLPAAIPAGAPICTVFAQADTPARTAARLRQRARALLANLQDKGLERPHDDTTTMKDKRYEQTNPCKEYELAQCQ